MWKADWASGRKPRPTGQARRTAQPRVEAVATGLGVEKAVAGGEVIGTTGKRPDRAGGEAGRGAGVAGPPGRGGKGEPRRKREGAAIGDEKAGAGVDEEAHGRLPRPRRSAAPRR